MDYRQVRSNRWPRQRPASFDLVTCLEMLEHVPDPAAIVASLARLVRPGGDVVCSTINRNAKSFALAIVGAEYLLRLLPMGTHQYARLIRPSELSRWAREAGLELADLAGLEYNPATRKARIGDGRLGQLPRAFQAPKPARCMNQPPRPARCAVRPRRHAARYRAATWRDALNRLRVAEGLEDCHSSTSARWSRTARRD